jgi:hypothetical protein
MDEQNLHVNWFLMAPLILAIGGYTAFIIKDAFRVINEKSGRESYSKLLYDRCAKER